MECVNSISCPGGKYINIYVEYMYMHIYVYVCIKREKKKREKRKKWSRYGEKSAEDNSHEPP